MDTYKINSIATNGEMNILFTLNGVGSKTMTISGLPLTSATLLGAEIKKMVTAYRAGLDTVKNPQVDASITAIVGVTQNIT